MAELPGNSQKPLAFGTICPAAFLLSLIRKEWGWMQSTSSPLDVMRLSKLGLLYSFSSPPFPHCCLFLFPLFLLSPSPFIYHPTCDFLFRMRVEKPMRLFSQSHFKNGIRKNKKEIALRGRTGCGRTREEDGGREESKALESGFTLAG